MKAALVVLLLVAPISILLVPESSAEDAGYQVVTYKTVKPSMDKIEVEYRVYDDMPNIPFTTINTIYDIYSGYEMGVTDNRDGTYTFTNPINSVTAVMDTNTGELSSERYDDFKIVLSEEDSHPRHIKIDSESTVKEPSKKTMSLEDYDIPYYADEGNVWLPIHTVADILMGRSEYYTYFGDSTVYCLDADSIATEDMPIPVVTLLMAFMDNWSKKERLADLTDYTYNELCFAIDNIFGKPEVSVLGKELQSSKLDDVLAKHDDTTRKIAQWLRSSDNSEYLAGMILLGMYLDDHGHTSFLPNLDMIRDEERAAEIKALLDSVDKPDIYDKSEVRDKLEEVRKEVWGDNKYIEEGDTAVFTFDQFDCDMDAWIEFYDKGGEIPDDAYGSVIKALNKAKANPEIKNFILDITTNGGGNEYTCFSILSLMTGDYSNLYMGWVDSGQKDVIKTITDTNLDGVFNEKDLKKQYDFNFGILCTKTSFSCGNLLPIYAQEHGIMILGERSGGGSCAIELAGTADSVLGTLSSVVILTDSKGNTVEVGATPDAVLVDTDDESADLSVLYDMDVLSEKMNDFYSPKSDGINVYTIVLIVLVILAAASLVVWKIRKN